MSTIKPTKKPVKVIKKGEIKPFYRVVTEETILVSPTKQVPNPLSDENTDELSREQKIAQMTIKEKRPEKERQIERNVLNWTLELRAKKARNESICVPFAVTLPSLLPSRNGE